MVLPAGDHDCMGCFIDQVKLTRALVQDLDEAVKEVKLLESMKMNHDRRSQNWKPCCKKLREDTHRLEEEKATLKGMVESHDELLMEIARDTGLAHMGEDAKDEEKYEDADGREDVVAPPVPAPLATSHEHMLSLRCRSPVSTILS
jgi:hypothetical protein